MKVDVIIAGQGLAGSLLAWHLIQKQLHVAVIDDGHRGSSSIVAAGLVNPITGKRLVKSWNVDSCLPAAVRFYRALETALQRPLYHEKSILRLFGGEQEQQVWARRHLQAEYRAYMGDAFESNERWPDTRGGFYIRQSGYLDTRELLAGITRFLQHRRCLIEARIDYRDIQIRPQEVRWQHLRAKRLIFCEGHRISANPWFRCLPLQPAQGEILTLKVDQPLPDHIINSGKWLLPIEPDHIKVGATFSWHPLDGEPTAKGRQELLAAFQRMWPQKQAYKQVAHGCGVRPGTRDKKPFIGMHPRYPQLGVFNGFGAKGALLMPYYADRFAAHISAAAPIPQEVDIRRFELALFSGE